MSASIKQSQQLKYGYIRDASLESNRKIQQSNAILIRILTCKCRDEEMDNEWRSAGRKGKEGRDWEEHKRIHHKLSEMNTKYEQ